MKIARTADVRLVGSDEVSVLEVVERLDGKYAGQHQVLCSLAKYGHGRVPTLT